MSDTTATPLKKTALHAAHVALGARMVPFGGWDMPVEYSGISAEHMAVRTGAGLFDVSHMGQIELAGERALAAVQHITSNDASKLQNGQAQYSALTTPEGTFVDDVLVYRFAERHYLLVVNASNIEKDHAWIAAHAPEVGEVAIVNSSDRYALIAVQGPKARGIVQRLTAIDLASIKYYWFAHGEIAGVRGTLSRTGYTGEDGWEIFVPPQFATQVWNAILEAGKPDGLVPCGLGARDTLRLEAAMRLYGNDMDEGSTVVECDLGWIVGWNKTEFIGRDVLVRQKAEGAPKKIVGFEMLDRAIARHGHDVHHGGAKVGVVTSGTHTPFLKKAIGMAYVPGALAAPGTEFTVDIRGRMARAVVVPMPFYKRPKGQ
jgi:aminomethyltransferase